jgi:hypothetical protein
LETKKSRKGLEDVSKALDFPELTFLEILKKRFLGKMFFRGFF